jgi:hypothetical protein
MSQLKLNCSLSILKYSTAGILLFLTMAACNNPTQQKTATADTTAISKGMYGYDAAF